MTEDIVSASRRHLEALKNLFSAYQASVEQILDLFVQIKEMLRGSIGYQEAESILFILTDRCREGFLGEIAEVAYKADGQATDEEWPYDRFLHLTKTGIYIEEGLGGGEPRPISIQELMELEFLKAMVARM